MNRTTTDAGEHAVGHDGCRSDRWTEDRGSMVPLLAIVLVGFVMAVGLIGVTARHYARSARAQWAADSAALAVAAIGPSSAGIEAGRLLAEGNGATFVSVALGRPVPSDADQSATSHTEINQPAGSTSSLSSIVVVVVDYRGVRATAAAQRFAVETP